MGYAQKILPHYTYDDYVLWEGKWELIDGFPIAMSPAPTPRHQMISLALGSEFRAALKKSGCKRCNAYMPIDYKVADDTILQPDLLIVCDEIKKKFLDRAPVLVVEILSESTALRDRHTKYQIYEEAGVKYYLMVSPDKNVVEVFANAKNGFKALEAASNLFYNFELEPDCTISVDLGTIWD